MDENDILDEFLPEDSPPTSATTPSKPKEAKDLPEWRPFPVETLPSPLLEYVTEGAISTGSDPAYWALPCLAACAAAIGHTRLLKVKTGYYQPSILWTATIGESGSMKSIGWRGATRYLSKLQHKFVTDYLHEKDKFEAALEEFRKPREKGDKSNKDNSAEEFQKPPVCRQIITNDTTIESLVGILIDNPKGFLVSRDELAGWIESFGRYTGSNSDLQAWLEFWEGGSLVINRRSAENRVRSVAAAGVSVTGTIQPELFKTILTPKYMAAGLGARFLLANPPRTKRVWPKTEMDATTQENYEHLIDWLLTIEFASSTEHGPQPVIQGFDPLAMKRWIEFCEDWWSRMTRIENPYLLSAWSKMDNQGLRLALVLHNIKGAWSYATRQPISTAQIQPDTIEAAITLCEWFGREAQRIYGVSDPNAAILQWIRNRGGTVTIRDLYTHRQCPNAGEAERLVCELMSTGQLREKQEGKKTLYFLPS